MNRNYKYGASSLKKINTTDELMQQVCHEAMRIANLRKTYCPDFGISDGLRTADEQFELYKKGRYFDGYSWVTEKDSEVVTYRDGHTLKSVHQSGFAIDFFAIDPETGEADFSVESLALVATCFFEASSNLGLNCDWGGSFKSISDAVHFELKA